ncbi:MAG: ATP-binding protein [Gammaproteobacteria bacterium]
MRSIRQQLLLALFATLVATFAVSGLLSYVTANHEVRELFDAQLVENARVLKGVMNHTADRVDWDHMRASLNDSDSSARPAEGQSYEKKVAIQVWTASGDLVLRTPSAPEYSLSPLQAGFHERRISHHRWHVYTTRLPENGHWLIVAERSDVRRELSLNIAASLTVGSLLGLALALWLSRRTLHRELQPLDELRAAITQRDPEHMHAIALQAPRAELAPVVSELNHLLQRVADSLEHERRFLADAAHELRTPLAVLKLQAENVLAAGASPEQRVHLERLVSGVDRSTRVVEQLLLLARLDANAVPLTIQTVALDELVRDTLAQLAPLADARRQELGLSYNGPALAVAGEPALLGALLRNLIENALRHTPEGGEVDVSLRTEHGNTTLQIRDTGPGIDPAHLGEITGRFVRSHSQDTHGTGLGLAIAGHIAGLHHALLHLANAPEGGLIVTVTFPANPAA